VLNVCLKDHNLLTLTESGKLLQDAVLLRDKETETSIMPWTTDGLRRSLLKFLFWKRCELWVCDIRFHSWWDAVIIEQAHSHHLQFTNNTINNKI